MMSFKKQLNPFARVFSFSMRSGERKKGKGRNVASANKGVDVHPSCRGVARDVLSFSFG